MTESFDLFVAGTPATQGNKTGFVNKKTGKVVMREGRTNEAKDRFNAWRNAVASVARDNIADRPPLADVPVVVTLTFGIQKPASAPKLRRTWPIKARSGDVDKLARACLDAITGVLIADDAQVVGLSITKDFGRPGVRLQLWPVDDGMRWDPEWHSALTVADV